MNGDLSQPVNWIWGLSLIALTIAIHATGVVVLALVDTRIRAWLASRRFGRRHMILIVIGLVAQAGMLLAVLHGIEAAIWAGAYLWLGALSSPLDAILYSVDSMSTRGASGLAVQQHWRMLGALEALLPGGSLDITPDMLVPLTESEKGVTQPRALPQISPSAVTVPGVVPDHDTVEGALPDHAAPRKPEQPISITFDHVYDAITAMPLAYFLSRSAWKE